MRRFKMSISNESGELGSGFFKSPHTLQEMMGFYDALKIKCETDDKSYFKLTFSRGEIEFVTQSTSKPQQWVKEILKNHSDDQFIVTTTVAESKLRLV